MSNYRKALATIITILTMLGGTIAFAAPASADPPASSRANGVRANGV